MTTTPTQKDAEALAVLDELHKRFSDTIPTPMNRRGESTMRIEHFVDLAHEAKQARAHLAARLAELTQQLEASIAMTGEQLRRADRAEAELAAAKVDAERGREISVAFLPVMEAMRPLVLNLERLKDAARGEGG